MVFIKVSNTGFMLDADTEDIIVSTKITSPSVRDIKLLLELVQLLIDESSDKIQTCGDKAHNAFLQKYTPEQGLK